MSAVDITTHTRLEWADRVQGLMVRANRDVGRELCAAKGDLPHGEFTVMVEQDLGRSLRWAEMLMSIAQHPIIGESKHASVLPADTTSLYGLSRLEPDTVEFYLAAGDLTRTSTRVEVRELCRGGRGVDGATPAPPPSVASRAISATSTSSAESRDRDPVAAMFKKIEAGLRSPTSRAEQPRRRTRRGVQNVHEPGHLTTADLEEVLFRLRAIGQRCDAGALITPAHVRALERAIQLATALLSREVPLDGPPPAVQS